MDFYQHANLVTKIIKRIFARQPKGKVHKTLERLAVLKLRYRKYSNTQLSMRIKLYVKGEKKEKKKNIEGNGNPSICSSDCACIIEDR